MICNMYQRDDYPYLYETHMHTNVGSRCGISSPEEQVMAAKEKGYTGVFITEHNWGGNTAIDRSLPWEEYIHQFCESYRQAKACGDKIGLQVFFAMEAGHNRGSDLLLYGIDEEWLLKHPELKEATVEEQYKLIKEAGGMVIHAHPFREAVYLKDIRLYPKWVDGIEVFNGTHGIPLKGEGHPEYDEEAFAYAKAHHFPMTAGSDAHAVISLRSGVAFRQKLQSPIDYIDAILNRKDYILVNYPDIYDAFGNRISGHI